jgi:AcrR family transcriptional regulator
MQDIFRASGLSAGAVYRYFPSKHLLIKALAVETLTSALAPIDLGDAKPRDAGEILTVIAGGLTSGGRLAESGAIAAQVWAEAFRDAEMAVIARDVLGLLLDRIREWLPDGSPLEAARLVLATLQGFVLQSGIFGDVTPELVAAGVDATFRSA